MTRLDRPGLGGGVEQVLATVRPDIVHLHGLDQIGAEVIPAVRRLAPRCRIVLTLHDYQLICPNEGLLLTTGRARCRGADPAAGGAFPSLRRRAALRGRISALLANVDTFIAPSAFLRDRFVDWGLDADRISARCPTRSRWRATRGRRSASAAGPLRLLRQHRAAQGRAGAARRRRPAPERGRPPRGTAASAGPRTFRQEFAARGSRPRRRSPSISVPTTAATSCG